MRQKLLRNVLTVVLAHVFFFLAGCGSIEIKSHWRDREVVIDGKNTEWRYLTPLEDKETSVGMLNDENFLYIILVSSNRDVHSQVVRRGLTFWFDNEGGKTKKFGVHYPLAFRGRPSTGDESPEEDSQSQIVRRESDVNEFEIFGPNEEDRHRMTAAETGGIEARVRTTGGILVYEMKVP